MKQILSSPTQAGLLLQSARKHRGLTQSAAAARLGLSQSRLSKLELDPASMTLGQLLGLCALLGLELTLAEKKSAASPAGRPPTEW